MASAAAMDALLLGWYAQPLANLTVIIPLGLRSSTSSPVNWGGNAQEKGSFLCCAYGLRTPYAYRGQGRLSEVDAPSPH